MIALIEKKHHLISRITEGILVVGFIIDFCFRRNILTFEHRYALIPFALNIVLLLIASKYTYDLKESNGHFKRTMNIVIKSLLNLTFMALIIWIPDKL